MLSNQFNEMLDDKINSMVFYHKLGLTTIDYVSCILYGQV